MAAQGNISVQSPQEEENEREMQESDRAELGASC